MRISRITYNKVATLINSYCNYNPSPLSLKKFADFGKVIKIGYDSTGQGKLIGFYFKCGEVYVSSYCYIILLSYRGQGGRRRRLLN